MLQDVDVLSLQVNEKPNLKGSVDTRIASIANDAANGDESNSLTSSISPLEKGIEVYDKTVELPNVQVQKDVNLPILASANISVPIVANTKQLKIQENTDKKEPIYPSKSSNNVVNANSNNAQSHVAALSVPAVPCSVSNLLSDILNMRGTSTKSASIPVYPSSYKVVASSFSNDAVKIESDANNKSNADIILNAVLNQPWMQSHRMMFPNTLSSALNKISWRKGKWIDEEELYTKKLIEAFNNGYLKIPTGTTLRSFLSEKLSCDPMRITKKFAGSSAIGKQVFTPCDPNVDPQILERVHAELKDLGEKFNFKIDITQNNSVSSQAIAIAAALRAGPSNMKQQSSQFDPYNTQDYNPLSKEKSLGLDPITSLNYNNSSREISPQYYKEPSLSSLYFGGDIKLSHNSSPISEHIKLKKSVSSLNLSLKQVKKEKNQHDSLKVLKTESKSSEGDKNISSSRINTTSESSSFNGNYSSENSDENLFAHKTHPSKPNISIASSYPQYPIINSSNGKALIFPHSHPKKKISAAASLAAAVASSCSSSKFDRDCSADESFYAVRHSHETETGGKSSYSYDTNENTKKIKRTNSLTNLNNINNATHHKPNMYGNVAFNGFSQRTSSSKDVENGNSIASFCNAAAHVYSNDNNQSRQSGRFPAATNVEQVDLDASDLLLNFFNSANYTKVDTVKTNSLTTSDSDANEPSGRSSSSSDRGTSAALSDVESTSSRNGEGNSHKESNNNKNIHHTNNVDNKKQKNDDITNIDHNNYYTLKTLQQNGESIASNAQNVIAASNIRKRFSYQMRDVNMNEINDSNKKIKSEDNINITNRDENV